MAVLGRNKSYYSKRSLSLYFGIGRSLGNAAFILHFLVGLLALTDSYAQHDKVENLYRWFDATIGEENSGLYYAVAYIDEYLTINDQHRYFKSPYFEVGTLYYEGQPYFEVLMKYDLFEDQLITDTKNISGLPSLQMRKQSVDSFSIHGQRFINLARKYEHLVKANEFYTVIYETAYFTLLKKFRKKDIRKLDRKRVYYNFKEDNKYALFIEGTVVNIRNRNDIKKQFPALKKTINHHYRSVRSSTNDNQFMLSLFRKIYRARRVSEKKEP